MANCFKGYIGIRGECTSAKIYIDDLPGISIENAADVVEGFERPIALVERSFNLAIDQVYADWINQLKEKFDYKEVFGSVEYKTASNKNWYTGQTNEILVIPIERIHDYLTLTRIAHLGLVVQAAKDIVITIKDKYDTALSTKKVCLKSGYNKISIDFESSEDIVYIHIPIEDLTIGSEELYVHSSSCNICVCKDDCMIITSNINVGFDIICQCVIDRCALLTYFWTALKVPILYKTGINFFLNVKGSNRINAYTRNSKEQVDYFLNLWQGGTDSITGIKTSSSYWQALKTAADSTISALRTLKLKPFSYNSNQICNVLP